MYTTTMAASSYKMSGWMWWREPSQMGKEVGIRGDRGAVFGGREEEERGDDCWTVSVGMG